MSHCLGYIHISGGIDANKNMLTDYMIYDYNECQWITLKYKRSKYIKDDSIDAINDLIKKVSKKLVSKNLTLQESAASLTTETNFTTVDT